jgi:hypothetical protein
MATLNRVQTLRSSTKSQRPTTGSREVGELYVNFADRMIGMIDAAKVAQDLVAVPFFSSTSDYTTGEYVFYNDRLYRAKAGVTASAFNASQWDAVLDVSNASGIIQAIDGAGSGIDADLLDGQQGAWYAPITSPALTGAPTAPTAAPGTNTTQIASTAFVAALGALKADLNSPVFTGDPRAPTPSAADNDTSVATTAYVTNAVTTGTTASAILTKLLTVDGAGSNLDADLLDGQTGTFYTTMSNMSGTISAAQHGNLSGGSLHAAATALTAGFMTDAPSDGVSYGRKNGTWATMVGGATIADTPPVSGLLPGQLWFESDSGNTFIWYSDANSSQWIQIAGELPDASYPVRTAETRNRIINASMSVSQENGSNLLTGPSAWPADQWHIGYGGPTFTAQLIWPGIGETNRIRMICTVAKPSLAATDFVGFNHRFEGIQVYDFGWGSATKAKQVMLRFKWRSPAGTYAVSINRADSNRSFVKEFTISAGQNNAETLQTIVIPGDTAPGTWNADNSLCFTLYFVIAAGSTYQGVSGWQSGDKYAVSAINGAATVNNTFELGEVGLYLDPDLTGLPPPWQMPDYTEELRACQRYYALTGFAGRGNGSSDAYQAVSIPFPVSMRIAPAASVTAGSRANVATVGVAVYGGHWARGDINAAGAGDYYCLNETAILNARM